ncbi:MAG: hypothetical protein R3C14_02275 [Caldilineaceae bacterium]
MRSRGPDDVTTLLLFPSDISPAVDEMQTAIEGNNLQTPLYKRGALTSVADRKLAANGQELEVLQRYLRPDGSELTILQFYTKRED